MHLAVDWREGYAVLINSPEKTDFSTQEVVMIFGADRVEPKPNGPAHTASEDFAFIFLRFPGSYIFIGNDGPGTQGACRVHNPGYDFNDEIIAPGGVFWFALVAKYPKAQNN